MTELGAGGGSGYPGAIDSNSSLEYNQSEGNRTRARAAVPNDLAAAIVAIETELGVDPAGTRATVVAYLQQEHTSTGAHNDAFVVNVSGTQTVTGQKTFTGGVNVSTSGFWGTATVTVSGFVRASGGSLLAAGGLATDSSLIAIKTRTLNIGDWDMDSTAAVTVPHGLTLANIRRVTAMVRNDVDNTYYSLPTYNVSITDNEYIRVDATDIVLIRGTSGFFDTTAFDSTAFNRGWIMIDHV